MNLNNQFNSYDNSTQNISISYNVKNDIEAFKQALMEINIPNEEIENIEQAIFKDVDSEPVDNKKLGSNVKNAIKGLLAKLGDGIITSSISTVIPALTKALMNYYGYPVEF